MGYASLVIVSILPSYAVRMWCSCVMYEAVITLAYNCRASLHLLCVMAQFVFIRLQVTGFAVVSGCRFESHQHTVFCYMLRIPLITFCFTCMFLLHSFLVIQFRHFAFYLGSASAFTHAESCTDVRNSESDVANVQLMLKLAFLAFV